MSESAKKSQERSTVLITGASVGIGRALAITFARAGHDLFLVSRDAAALREVALVCEREGKVQTYILSANLLCAGTPAEIFDWVQKQGRVIDVLVNNAAFGLHGAFSATDIEQEVQMVQIQIEALLRLTKLFIPGMIERKRGRLLNVSSVYAFAGVPYQAVYGACKAFLFYFSQGLAAEVRDAGVTVTVLCPGTTRTEFRKRAGIREKSTKAGMSAEAVADAGYRATMGGDLLRVPGAINKLFVFLIRLLPVTWVGSLMSRINRVRGVNH